MKFIKYSFAAVALIFLASCLKPKSDFAGLREDKGGIVVSLAEAQYANTDANVIGFGFQYFANFSFSAPASESVRFFTLHISQPRSVKMSGPMTVKVSMTSDPGYDPIPAGAITVADIIVPASAAASFDYPVKFTVNKSLLDPNAWYAVIFTITSVSQGVFSDLDKSTQVVINEDPGYNNSKFVCRYKWISTVQDPANQFTITNNTKPVNLLENSLNTLDIFDFYAWALSAATTYTYLWANNVATGANTAIFRPRYNLDGTGKITSITNVANGAGLTITNIALDASGGNQFTYTSNDDRTMKVKYTFDLTSTINSVVTTRKVTVTESYVYDQMQAFY